MNNNSDMAFIDHLEELRWRILKSLGSVLVMSILTFNFADYFVYMLTAPADNRGIGLQTLTPQGMFILKWNLAIIGGFILSIPVITIQIWKFVSPGLYNKERKILLPLIILTSRFSFSLNFVAFLPPPWTRIFGLLIIENFFKKSFNKNSSSINLPPILKINISFIFK